MKTKQLRYLLIGCLIGIVATSSVTAGIFDEAGQAQASRLTFAAK